MKFKGSRVWNDVGLRFERPRDNHFESSSVSTREEVRHGLLGGRDGSSPSFVKFTEPSLSDNHSSPLCEDVVLSHSHAVEGSFDEVLDLLQVRLDLGLFAISYSQHFALHSCPDPQLVLQKLR